MLSEQQQRNVISAFILLFKRELFNRWAGRWGVEKWHLHWHYFLFLLKCCNFEVLWLFLNFWKNRGILIKLMTNFYKQLGKFFIVSWIVLRLRNWLGWGGFSLNFNLKCKDERDWRFEGLKTATWQKDAEWYSFSSKTLPQDFSIHKIR